MSPTKYDETPLEELDFSVRTYSCLKREGIDDIGQLAVTPEDDLMHIRNFGMRNIEEIRSKLAEYEEDWR